MKRSNARLRFLYILFGIFIVAVIVNVVFVTVFRVHIRSNTELDDYVESVANVEETIFASRGTIYANDGEVVAQDVQTYDIICYLDSNRLSNGSDIAYVDDFSYTAKCLAPILGTSEQEIYDYLSNGKENNLFQTELGACGRNLSEEQVEEINSIKDLHGIGFRNSYKRYYPYGELYSPQLLGFAQSDENGKLVGKLGIEASLNDELSGKDGTHSYQIDKNGYTLPGMYDETMQAVDGYDVYLTLDVSIQEALNTCLETTMEYKDATRAWGAVVEINSGKILAWGQTPSYDPNNLTSDDVQVNYGSQLVYEPGSVMKSIIYSAAMDLGTYDGTNTFDSSPYCYTDDTSRTYSDNKLGCIYNVSKLNWGTIELDYGLIYSSNVATATLLSEYVGVDNYEEYLNKYHLYEKVNTDNIDELSGYTNYGLSPVDCITATYGQGSTTTMLQLLQAYTAIFGNGEMIKPYIIDKIVDPNTSTVVYQGTRNVVSTPIKESTAKQMQDLLRRVVSDENGTCRHYEAKTVKVLGKTGTSEIAIDGEYSDDINIISCMLAFPYENPQYMVYYAYVSDETVYYNYDVKPCPDLIDRIALLEGLNVSDDDNNREQKITKYEMPNIKSISVGEANDILDDYDINIIQIGDGENIIDQYPKVGADLYTNEKVFILTDGNNISLPDFTNWTRKEIISYWNLSGLAIQLNGYGIVYEQSLVPNTIVDKSSEIIVYLKDINSTETTSETVEENDE